MKSVDILGYNIRTEPRGCYNEKIKKVLSGSDRNCTWMACINPHSYAVAREIEEFRTALNSADWLVPDGIGIVIASRILSRRIEERVTGNDIFECVMSELDQRQGSVFFLGSTEETLHLIAQQLPLDYPNIRLVGVYSPPFKQEFDDAENQAMIAAIAAVKPDVLWVGMTAPKQEMWIAAHRDELPVKFAGAIGAVFDFYTGQIKRSHPTFQRLGLEWLPRLVQEPKRLWRRMLVSAPVFLFDVFRCAVFDRQSKARKP